MTRQEDILSYVSPIGDVHIYEAKQVHEPVEDKGAQGKVSSVVKVIAAEVKLSEVFRLCVNIWQKVTNPHDRTTHYYEAKSSKYLPHEKLPRTGRSRLFFVLTCFLFYDQTHSQVIILLNF